MPSHAHQTPNHCPRPFLCPMLVTVIVSYKAKVSAPCQPSHFHAIEPQRKYQSHARNRNDYRGRWTCRPKTVCFDVSTGLVQRKITRSQLLGSRIPASVQSYHAVLHGGHCPYVAGGHAEILSESVKRFVKYRISEGKSAKNIAENMIKAQACERQFQENLCASQYAPAMQEQCTTWKVCMTSDPGAVNRAALIGGYASKSLESTLENLTFVSLVSRTQRMWLRKTLT